MSTRLKVLIGLIGTLSVLVLALIFFLYYLITKSYPVSSGTVNVAGMRSEVRIYRDAYGVPHIFASTEQDAYYAVGYVHAQDRLWQMELFRRAGQGRLAEVLGEPALKVDRMFRTLGLWQHAQKTLPMIDPVTRSALQAYADGVTEYIVTRKGKYPVEFDLLNYEPEPWTIEHSLLISRLMAWELNYSRWTDIVLSQLVERLGAVKASEVFPTWPEGAPLIVHNEVEERIEALGANQLLDADQAFRSLIGSSGLESGSNAWAVSGARSVTGKPILANDPHLLFAAPGRWYELHVIGPDLDVAGSSIAGVPFVVIGRNRAIAWGVTNAMLDDEDFYAEEVDSAQHPTRYRLNNAWRPLEARVDTILVKDGPPVLLTVYQTHRGPIVNRMEPSAQFSRYLLSMKWVGHEVSNEARAFYIINHAQNWKDFLEGLRHFYVPAQNFVYADTAGNIGYHIGGRIPIRRTKTATLVFPGWTDENDWKGYVPFEEMPQVFNPREGFVAAANNRIISESYPYYLSNLWEPEWRIERITEVLRSQARFSADDMQKLQLDVVSPQARELVPIIRKAYEGHEPENADVQTSLLYFKNWDFGMKADDVATTLFQAFLVRMVDNTFRDEMGPQLLALYDTLATTPLAALTKLMKKGYSPWFDNVYTQQIESRDDIIRQSLVEALSDLRTKHGGEIKEWRWGSFHQAEFPHVFSSDELLRRLFTVGPFPVGGSHSTVNKGDFPLLQGFGNWVGPSTRQVYDLSDPENDRAVTPPGQSGQVFQRHYDDQMPLWLSGAYRRRAMDKKTVEQSGYDLLILRPNR
jgi:penicillin amidase